MEIDVQEHVREENNTKLPSEAMIEEFELWEKEYTVDNLTDLTVSQIESRRLRFENQVQQLVTEHNPGKAIENNPALAATVGKPAYTPEEWEEARKTIWRKKEEITLRFDQAKGKVKKEKSASKMNQLAKIADSVFPDSVGFSFS